jgi:hypothetical protein
MVAVGCAGDITISWDAHPDKCYTFSIPGVITNTNASTGLISLTGSGVGISTGTTFYVNELCNSGVTTDPCNPHSNTSTSADIYEGILPDLNSLGKWSFASSGSSLNSKDVGTVFTSESPSDLPNIISISNIDGQTSSIIRPSGSGTSDAEYCVQATFISNTLDSVGFIGDNITGLQSSGPLSTSATSYEFCIAGVGAGTYTNEVVVFRGRCIDTLTNIQTIIGPGSDVPTLACNGYLKISLAGSERVITPAMMLPGQSTTNRITYIEGTNTNVIDCNNVGQNVKVVVLDTIYNQKCWGEVFVQDIVMPIASARDTVISCLDNMDALTAESLLQVNSSCNDLSEFDITFADIRTAGDCDSGDTLKYIERTWIIRSPNGHVINEVSNIVIEKVPLDTIVFPGDTTIYCPDTSFAISNTGGINLDLDSLVTYCKLQVGFSDRTIPTGCSGMRKVERKWLAIDWCNNTMVDTIQYITLLDTLPPVLTCPIGDASGSRKILTKTDTCGAYFVLNNCSNMFLETFGAGAGRSSNPNVGVAYTYLGTGRIEDGFYAEGIYTDLDDFNFMEFPSGADSQGDPNGRYLFFNASFVPGEFYRQSITGLTVGNYYTVSFYGINTVGGGIRPNTKINIEDTSSNIIAFYETGDWPAIEEWRQYSFTFQTTETDIDFVLINNAPGGSGNDLAIDHISFCADFDIDATDSCSPDSLIEFDVKVNGVFVGLTDSVFMPIGQNIVEYIAIDDCGNSSSCMDTITVEDATPPTINGPLLIQVTHSGTGNTEIPISLLAQAYDIDDNCALDSVFIRRTSTSCGVPGDLTFGQSIHICCADADTLVEVELQAKDSAGLTNTLTIMIDVKDGTPPVITCRDTTVFLDASGVFVLSDSSLFITSLSDNCNFDIDITYSRDTLVRADTNAVVPLTITAMDIDGGTSSCMSMVTVMDTFTNSGMNLLIGRVADPFDEGLGGIEISLNAKQSYVATLVTDEKGLFEIPENIQSDDLSLSIEGYGNELSGVSSLDLFLIQKHILGLQDLDNNYLELAADIDQSGEISVRDLIGLQNAILDLPNRLELPWLFLEQNHSANELVYSSNELIPIVRSDIEFRAVKMGDVNGDIYDDAMGRSKGSVDLLVEEKIIEANTPSQLPFTIMPKNGLVSFHLIVDLKNIIDYSFIVNHRLDKNVIIDTYNDGKRLQVIGYGSFGQDKLIEIGYLELNSEEEISSLDIIEIDNSSEVYSEDYSVQDIDIAWYQEGDVILSSNNKLFDVFPNPAVERVNFRISAESRDITSFKIMDITGKQIIDLSTFVKSNFSIPTSLFPTSGSYMVSIETRSGVQNDILLINKK